MKILYKLSIVLFLFVLTNSCEKDEIITDTGKMEAELNAFVQKYNITKCEIFSYGNGSYIQVSEAASFTISNGFIKTNTGTALQGYNLLYLYSYWKTDYNILHMEFIKN
jgi:hypothetical protein